MNLPFFYYAKVACYVISTFAIHEWHSALVVKFVAELIPPKHWAEKLPLVLVAEIVTCLCIPCFFVENPPECIYSFRFVVKIKPFYSRGG